MLVHDGEDEVDEVVEDEDEDDDGKVRFVRLPSPPHLVAVVRNPLACGHTLFTSRFDHHRHRLAVMVDNDDGGW